MKSIVIWLLLGTIFAASCLAIPQRPNKQGNGAIQAKQNKKQQAPNNKAKPGSKTQNSQRKAVAANAKPKNPTQSKIANGNRPVQQKKIDAIKPGVVKPNNKKVISKAGAIGGAVVGGAAAMAMPALWNQDVPNGDLDAPVGIAVEPYLPEDGVDAPPSDVGKEYMNDMQLCVMPYAPFLPFPDNPFSPDFMQPFPMSMLPPMPMPPIPPPPMFWLNTPNSDEPPTISADTDPEQAKLQKMMWLTTRVMQNQPYSLDDPRLNLSDEEKTEIAGKLAALPKNSLTLSSLIGGGSNPIPGMSGPFMQQGSLADGQMTFQNTNYASSAASSISVAQLGADASAKAV